MTDDQIFVATESGSLFADGERYAIRKGQTRVRAGHPLLERNSHMFKPLDVHYDVEDTTARPGQKRGGRRRQAEAPQPEKAADSTAKSDKE